MDPQISACCRDQEVQVEKFLTKGPSDMIEMPNATDGANL